MSRLRAVTLAGLKKLVADGRVGPEETAVLLLTGHTLKDSEYTIKFHRGELLSEDEMSGATAAERAGFAKLQREPLVLEADVDVVLRAIRERKRGSWLERARSWRSAG